MDYVPYTVDEYQPDAPATALHYARWFQNWEAGADGAAGAPRIKGRALGGIVLGRITLPGNSAGWVGMTALDRHGWIRCRCSMGFGDRRIRFSNDGGASWGAEQNLNGFGAHYVYDASWGTLLHKSSKGGTSPFPRRTYPATSVIGVPSAVKPFSMATRTWNSAT